MRHRLIGADSLRWITISKHNDTQRQKEKAERVVGGHGRDPQRNLQHGNADQPIGGPQLAGVVDDLGYLGNRSLYRIRLESGKIVQVSSQNRRRSMTRFLEWEDKVWISWRPRSAVVLLD